MTTEIKINKQFYEDACKLIEKPNGWLKYNNFGINGEGKSITDSDEIISLVKGEANCWCMNGALVQVIIGDDTAALRRWFDGTEYDENGNECPDPDKYKLFYEHHHALNVAFMKHLGEREGFIYYNDYVANSGQQMANKVREIVAKMEG